MCLLVICRELSGEVISKEITIEVLLKLRKKLIECRFGTRRRFHGENVAQMRHAAKSKLVEVFWEDHAAVEEVAGKYQAAKQGIENRGLEIALGDLNQDVAGILEIAQEGAVHPIIWIKRAGVALKKRARFHRCQEFAESLRNSVEALNQTRRVATRIVLRGRLRHSRVDVKSYPL